MAKRSPPAAPAALLAAGSPAGGDDHDGGGVGGGRGAVPAGEHGNSGRGGKGGDEGGGGGGSGMRGGGGTVAEHKVRQGLWSQGLPLNLPPPPSAAFLPSAAAGARNKSRYLVISPRSALTPRSRYAMRGQLVFTTSAKPAVRRSPRTLRQRPQPVPHARQSAAAAAAAAADFALVSGGNPPTPYAAGYGARRSGYEGSGGGDDDDTSQFGLEVVSRAQVRPRGPRSPEQESGWSGGARPASPGMRRWAVEGSQNGQPEGLWS